MDPFTSSLRSPSISSNSSARKGSVRKSVSVPNQPNSAFSATSPFPSGPKSGHQNFGSDSVRSYQSDNVFVDLQQLPANLVNTEETKMMNSPQHLQSPQFIRDTSNTLGSVIKKTKTAFDFQSKQNVRKTTVWEPPNACQRRILPISNFQQYFPIELTSRDYFHRVLGLILIMIEFLQVERLEKYQKNTSGEEIPMELEEFINLLLAQLSNRSIGEIAIKLNLLANVQSRKIADNLIKYITTILEIKDQLFAVTTLYYHYDFNALQDDLNPLFDTTYYLLLLIQEFLEFPNIQHATTSTSVVASTAFHHINLDTMILEIKELQSQWKLQKVFQLQKLSYLGWDVSNPSANASAASTLSLFSPLGENSTSDRNKKGLTIVTGGRNTSDESKDNAVDAYYEQIMKKAETAKKRIKSILSNFSEKNTIMLIIRIYTIIEDLTILSNEIGEIGDYQEAYRLRQLLTSIDLSINSNYSSQLGPNRLSMNRLSLTNGADENGLNEFSKLLLQSDYVDFRKYLDCLYIFKNDFYNLLLELIQLFDKEKVKNNYTKMIAIENSLNELNDSYSQLLYITRKVSLINQPNIVSKIHLEGTSFITSNFLFISEYEDEKCNLAALLIRSESEYLLLAIESWPELTLLNRSLFNQVSSAELANKQKEEERQIADEALSITDTSVDWNGSVNNNTVSNFSRNNLSGIGYTTSMVLSNTSQYKKEFSHLIYETLQSFELLLKQLNILLTIESLAHSELICRLIGIRDDLYSLIEVNTHATNQIEAERLLELVSIFDNTIDADEQDNLLHHQYLFMNSAIGHEDEEGGGGFNPSLVAHQHPYAASTHQLSEIGRGRKRIDNIYHFIQNIVDGVNELNKLKLRAKSINDFIAMKSIDKMITVLKAKSESLEKTITPFHLLDHENDVSSYGNTLVNANNNNNQMMLANNQPKIAQNIILDINERIAREGTEFLTSDFLFSYCCGPKGHSIGSLAIVSGCGAVLRFIKSYWPTFSILGGNVGNSNMNPNTSGVEDRLLNYSMESSFMLHHSMSFKNANNPVNDINNIDFRNANTMRLLGFDAKSLQLAGFSTIDILTAGFTAEQLKSTGFGIEMIRAIPYFDHYFTRAIGYQLETQGKILLEFFYSTNGLGWKKNEFWKELDALLRQISNAAPMTATAAAGNSTSNTAAMIVPSFDNINNLLNNSKSQQQIVLLNLLKKLFGIMIQEPVFDPLSPINNPAIMNNNNTNLGATGNTTSNASASNLLFSGNNTVSTVNNSNSNSGMNNSNTMGSGNDSGVGGIHRNVDASEVTKLILTQNNLNGMLNTFLSMFFIKKIKIYIC
jgi:hypothetical protein